ncbi:MAG: hypothetical protein K2N78_00940 [Oscillospiraceae bacterium]|nr:hypothetical protein [Oscillospiraceae bacterium]
MAEGTVGIELTEENGKLLPRFSQAYIQSMECAVRRTKQHKYHNQNDIAVCAVLDSENHEVAVGEVCRRICQDLENAYFNHVFFDLYFMISEEFTPSGPLREQNLRIMEDLETISQEDWVRYIFLVSDVTNEELALASAAEQFRAVLHSVVLTNCRSSTGVSSALVNEQLMMEAQDLESKFLSLGRIELALEHDLVQAMIQYEMLEGVFRMPMSRRETADIPLAVSALRSDIRQMVRPLSDEIEKIAVYRCVTSQEAAEHTNQELLSACFHNGPEAFMRENEERLHEECGQWMKRVYRVQITAWLDHILQKAGPDICDIECCRAVYREACGEIQTLRKKNEQDCGDHKRDFSEWKDRKVRVSRWWTWFPAEHWQFRILEEWTAYWVREQACVLFERCLRDIESYAVDWLKEKESLCNALSRFRLDAAAALEAKQNDCSDTKRCLAEFYQQELKACLGDQILLQFQRDLNGFLERQADSRALMSCIQTHTARLYASWMAEGSRRSGSVAEQCGMWEVLYASVLKRAVLYMRGQTFNVDPYICILGRREDPLVAYIRGQGSVHSLVFETEIEEVPLAFYYQNIRGPRYMPSCRISRRRAESGVEGQAGSGAAGNQPSAAEGF